MDHYDFCMWCDAQYERLHNAGVSWDVQKEFGDVADKAWAYVVGYRGNWDNTYDPNDIIVRYLNDRVISGEYLSVVQLVSSELARILQIDVL